MDQVLNATVENATAVNGTSTTDDPQGLVMAYISLTIMTLVPIYFGSLRSVTTMIEKKKKGEAMDTITSKDAAMFPFIASGALFGIFIFFKVFNKDYINMLMLFYFFFLGMLAFSHMINPTIRRYLPDLFPNKTYHILVEEQDVEKKTAKTEFAKFDFQRKDIIGMVLAGGIGAWYLWNKHWMANNLFGLAFAFNAIELIQLNKVITGCILLGGLFVYDIFWVFYTSVMVTVAKSFEAPIKLLFPRDIITNGLAAKNFAMLGLGDIVVPGIFLALLLRFDNSVKPGSKKYFISGFSAYILGLVITICVMHVFKHAQPALLYLVPTCLGIPMATALISGDLTKMLAYVDAPAEEGEVNQADGDTKMTEPAASGLKTE